LYIKNNSINLIVKTNLLYKTKKINNILLKKNKFFNLTYFGYLYENGQIKNNNYFYMPIKTFFENIEIFFNTEGLIKKSCKFFNNNKNISNWKLFRMFFIKLKNKNYFSKTNFLINFSLKNRFNFFKTIFLFYLAKKTSNDIYFKNNINLFYFKKINIILYKQIKLINNKIKLWVNDFFINSRSNFTNNSKILLKCAKINRLKFSNFF
jgi:hypothetical protein